jgi:hypothetical protein
MKQIFIISMLLFFCFTGTAQIRSNNAINATIANQSAFFDASGGIFTSSVNNGKGLVFPRTNLTTFTFERDGNALAYPTRYDGMIVYNTTEGTTPAAGPGVRSGVGSQSVTPGFYYFSNPTSASVVGNGQWLPLGGPSATVKEATILNVSSDGENAILDLGTTVLAANAVTTFLEAKVYDGSNNLVMTASGAYNKATNELTLQNGFFNQVLPVATNYKVVVSYK